MNKPYNIFYNNMTGRVVVQKLDKNIHRNLEVNNPKSIEINNSNSIEVNNSKNVEVNNKIDYQYDIRREENNNTLKYKKNVLYGIKKTILSDFNYFNNSSHSADFKIGLNKNMMSNKKIFDAFYLFPNICELNTKTETNIINEKKVDMFQNLNEVNDVQSFPIDFIPCGINIPFKNAKESFKKLCITNIYWNIFQSIDISKYKKDELLSVVPDKNDFIYKNTLLQVSFELHSQINNNIIHEYSTKILPYRNTHVLSPTPANTCLYKTPSIYVDRLNGSLFDKIEIPLLKDLNLDCALLCVRICVPDDSISILKGLDKFNKSFYGFIPFSQFVLNFDYELY